MKRPLIESRTVHTILLIAGGALLFLALVQLPVSIFIQYSRPSLPWFPVEYVPEGLRVVPVISRENEPVGNFEVSDIITEVSGMQLDSADLDRTAWEQMVAGFRIGDTLQVRLLRGDSVLSFSLTLNRSISEIRGKEISMISLIIQNISPVIMLLVGYVVLIRRPRRRESVLFFSTLFFYALYMLIAVQVAMYMPWWSVLGEARALISEIAFMFFLPLLLHFLLVFPNEWFMRNHPRLRLLLIYGPFVTVSVAVYLLLHILELPLVRIMATTADAVYVAAPLVGLWILRISYRHTRTPIHRRLLNVITTGMLFFSIGFLVTILVNHMYLYHDYLVPSAITIRLGALLLITLALPVTFGYALLRYGFLDIQFFFRRTTLYVILSAFIILVFILLDISLSWLFDSFTTTDVLLVSVIVTAVVAIFIGIGKNQIQQYLDRRLFREEWEIRELMQGLSRSMLNMLEHEQLLQALSSHVPEILDVEFASVVALREDGGSRLLAGSSMQEDVINRLVEQSGLFTRLSEGEVIDTYSLPGGSMLHGLNAIVGITEQDGEFICFMLGTKRSGRGMNAEEFSALRGMAEYAMLGWRNASLSEQLREKERMKHEVQVAKQIQTAMMPAGTPSSPVFDIAAVSIPAREVGGDFYDFMRLEDGRLCVVVGDVSDKGVSAAMIMSSTISTLRFAAERLDSPRDILAVANRRLFQDTFRQMFSAVCMSVLDEARLHMTFTNAGLPKPLLLRDGESFLIEWSDDGTHFPLGMVEDTVYHEEELPLQRGDVLVFYSDGVTESTNGAGEEFGVRRMRDSVRAASAESSHELLEHIISDVQRHRGDTALFDDLTLMVVRVR